MDFPVGLWHEPWPPREGLCQEVLPAGQQEGGVVEPSPGRRRQLGGLLELQQGSVRDSQVGAGALLREHPQADPFGIEGQAAG